MEWRYSTSPRTKKFKAQKLAGKIMASVFWDSKGVILVDFMPTGTAINSELNHSRNSREEFAEFDPNWKCQRCFCSMTTPGRTPESEHEKSSVLLGGALSLTHPVLLTWHHLTTICLDSIRRDYYSDDDQVKDAVRNWLRAQPAKFYATVIHALVHRWTTALERGDHVEKWI